MPNCGECLVEHVAIVPLRANGSCPCCEKRHAPTPDPDVVLARIKRRKANRKARREAYKSAGMNCYRVNGREVWE